MNRMVVLPRWWLRALERRLVREYRRETRLASQAGNGAVAAPSAAVETEWSPADVDFPEIGEESAEKPEAAP